jgi:hypothetical protein
MYFDNVKVLKDQSSSVLWDYTVTSAEQTIDVPSGLLNHDRLLIYLDITNDDASGSSHYVYINDSGGTINTTDTDYHYQLGHFGNGNTTSGQEGDGPKIGGAGSNESYQAILNLSCIQRMVASYQSQVEIVAGSDIRCYIGGWEYEQTLPDAITELRFYAEQASGFGVGTRIRIIDPTVAQTGAPSLYEDDEVRIPGEWWQDPNNTSDYYPKYRKVVSLGSLPNATSATTAHGITNYHLDSMSVYGHADNGSAVLPLPFVNESGVGTMIRLQLDGSGNVYVNTGATNRSSYTGYAILEYAKTTDTPVTRAQAYGNGGGARLISPVRYTTDAGQSIPNASGTVVNFEDKEYDDDNTVTTGGSWVFTAPKNMYVNVSATVTLSSRTWTDGELAQLNVRVNGSLYALIYRDVAQTSESRRVTLAGSADIKLSSGDTLDIQLYQNSGSSLAIDSITGFNWVSIHEIPISL